MDLPPNNCNSTTAAEEDCVIQLKPPEQVLNGACGEIVLSEKEIIYLLTEVQYLWAFGSHTGSLELEKLVLSIKPHYSSIY